MTADAPDARALIEAGRYAEAEQQLRAAADPAQADLLETAQMLQGRATVPADPEARLRLARDLVARRGPRELYGRDEGPRIEQALSLLADLGGDLPAYARPQASHLLWSAGAFEAAQALGDLEALAGAVARDGSPAINLLARVRGEPDRQVLLDQHRAWAAKVERGAGTVDRARRGGGPPWRLGLLTSDLRFHSVGVFVHPLFAHRDPRFELYVYSSFPGAADEMQQWFAANCIFRQLPDGDAAAAAMIAADGLDMLIDVGGPTTHNRPELLAWRTAPLQASWLGYPHSLGLAAVDHLIVDPYLVPERADLMLEAPLLMPSNWICMGPAAFEDEPAPAPRPPVMDAGHIAFGTANHPYKYTPEALAAWARIVAAVPNSRFRFLRPEAGAPSFQANMARAFEAEGVAADRLDYVVVRGAVQRAYGLLDIALDTFPLTGGTTTCDALWAGVPTVSLVGEAIYERMSWSILANAGLPDLAARRLDDYARIAVELAGDVGRLAALRTGLRAQIRSRPLGQADTFAADFYEMLAGAIAARPV